MRETFEETGFLPELLSHALTTHATRSNASQTVESSTEPFPFAISQRFTADNTLKVTFWFAAQVNSEDIKVDGTQDVGEDFDTVWISFDDVRRTMSFEDDCKIAMRVVDDVRQSTSFQTTNRIE